MGIASVLNNSPGSRTFFYHDIVMRYYTHDVIVEAGPSRAWNADMARIAIAGRYDYVAIDHTMFSRAFPSINEVAASLLPNYELIQRIPHRRTGHEVAYVLARVK